MAARLLLLVFAWLLLPGGAQAQSMEQFSGDATWNGFYWYPIGANQRPVPFTFNMEEAGGRVAGRITEPNTFGHSSAKNLYANVKGDIRQDVLRFTKTYDGTGGQSHSVVYEGHIVDGGRAVVGYWRLQNTVGGFTMRRLGLTGMIDGSDPRHAAWQGGEMDGSDLRPPAAPKL